MNRTVDLCRSCGHFRLNHIRGLACTQCRCGTFEKPPVHYDGRDRCRTCDHIRDRHLSSGSFLPCLVCLCDDFTPEGATLHLPDHDSTAYAKKTGDTNMSEPSYNQVGTLKTALHWIANELLSSDDAITWAELSSMTAGEIVTRYATRQRDIIAELAKLTDLMDSPVSESVASLHNDSYKFTRDREKAERELRNAEILLSFTTPDEPVTEPAPAAPKTTFIITVTETPEEA